MCTLLAGGGVFWAAAEPMAHFSSPPPIFGGESGTKEAAFNALAQSFMRWGFFSLGYFRQPDWHSVYAFTLRKRFTA